MYAKNILYIFTFHYENLCFIYLKVYFIIFRASRELKCFSNILLIVIKFWLNQTFPESPVICLPISRNEKVYVVKQIKLNETIFEWKLD